VLGFEVWAYVIMPEHVYVLIWSRQETYSISAILKAVKQGVARRAIAYLRVNNPAGLQWVATGRSDKPYEFWQDGGGYDRNVRNSHALRKMMTYIHSNPVTRGLVARPEDWLWSSAQDWAGLRAGPIPIDKESCLNSLA
jgi:putative transposase